MKRFKLLGLVVVATVALVATPSAFGNGAVLMHGDGGTAWFSMSSDSYVITITFTGNPGDILRINPDGSTWIHLEVADVPLTVAGAKHPKKVLFSGVGSFNFSASVIVDFDTLTWYTDDVSMIGWVRGEVTDADGAAYDLDGRAFFVKGEGDVVITVTPQ